MTTQSQQVADMATTIRTTQGMVDFLAGGDRNRVEAVAEEWVNAGFDCDTAKSWWDAGAFDADRTSYIRSMGLTPEQAADDHPSKEASWAYGYSNGDISDLEIADFFQLH